MTAAAPHVRVRSAFPRGFAPPAESGGDSIFVILLSLNFMLLAFFILIGTTATVDKSRALTIAQNVRVTFSGTDEPEEMRVARLSAQQVLQTGVSDALADLLPVVPRPRLDNSDRVDVVISRDALPALGNGTVQENIAQLLQAPASGYRYVLLMTGAEGSASDGAAFTFAGSLVDRGVAPQNLLIGSTAREDNGLHLSFMIFEGESDDAGPWRAGLLAPAAPEGSP